MCYIQYWQLHLKYKYCINKKVTFNKILMINSQRSIGSPRHVGPNLSRSEVQNFPEPHSQGSGGQSRSPDGAVHHEVDRGASRELPDGALLHRRVDFDLPHVCVPAVLVVGEHSDLDHEGADGLVCPLRHTHNKILRFNAEQGIMSHVVKKKKEPLT